MLATVTVAAIATVTESSLSPADPPLSCSVVMVTTLCAAVVGESSVFLYAIESSIASSAASEIPPASAVTVTVAVVPTRLTTTAILLPPVVSATQVADAVMSQSEPSITRYSSVSCTFVTVITNDRNVCVACASESPAAAELNRTRLLPPSVKVSVAPVAVRVGSSFSWFIVRVYTSSVLDVPSDMVMSQV